jgi:hypothetical protein
MNRPKSLVDLLRMTLLPLAFLRRRRVRPVRSFGQRWPNAKTCSHAVVEVAPPAECLQRKINQFSQLLAILPRVLRRKPVEEREVVLARKGNVLASILIPAGFNGLVAIPRRT